mmetsp:Transcript_116656/g.371108  ORF Transcript_116656/g.371108 Transcript_116656/m.371108 type:complete len:227 (-) Transcript_116656:1066-1746(-)
MRAKTIEAATPGRAPCRTEARSKTCIDPVVSIKTPPSSSKPKGTSPSPMTSPINCRSKYSLKCFALPPFVRSSSRWLWSCSTTSRGARRRTSGESASAARVPAAQTTFSSWSSSSRTALIKSHRPASTKPSMNGRPWTRQSSKRRGLRVSRRASSSVARGAASAARAASSSNEVGRPSTKERSWAHRRRTAPPRPQSSENSRASSGTGTPARSSVRRRPHWPDFAH